MAGQQTPGAGPPEAEAAAKAAADKAAADKAAADTAAAEAAAQNAAADKAAADTAAADAAAARQPVVPETYDLKLPDGSPFDATDLAGFSAEAKASRLTAEQAQSLVDARIGLVQSQAAQYLADLKDDQVLGGAKFDETVQLAKRGLDAFLTDMPADEASLIKGWFDRTGLGNHKALVRGFARLGKLMAEDTPAGGGAGAQGKPVAGTPEAQAAVLYPSMAAKS